MLFKKACIPFFLVVLIIVSVGCGGSTSPTQEPQSPFLVPATETPAPSPTVTSVAPTETPLPEPSPSPSPTLRPTEEPAKEIEEISGGIDRRDPANIPDFYLQNSEILQAYALETEEGESRETVAIVLVAYDNIGKNFIAELAIYDSGKFAEEMESRTKALDSTRFSRFLDETQRRRELSRWRPIERDTSFLAWLPLAEMEDGTELKDGIVPVYVYKRAEGGELMYAGTERMAGALFFTGNREVARAFLEIFSAYTGPQGFLEGE